VPKKSTLANSLLSVDKDQAVLQEAGMVVLLDGKKVKRLMVLILLLFKSLTKTIGLKCVLSS
jgi:hypothetical protein